MKRYIIIGYWKDYENGEISSKDEITREDLSNVKTKDYSRLIDTREGKWFDAENNEWKEIK